MHCILFYGITGIVRYSHKTVIVAPVPAGVDVTVCSVASNNTMHTPAPICVTVTYNQSLFYSSQTCSIYSLIIKTFSTTCILQR